MDEYERRRRAISQFLQNSPGLKVEAEGKLYTPQERQENIVRQAAYEQSKKKMSLQNKLGGLLKNIALDPVRAAQRTTESILTPMFGGQLLEQQRRGIEVANQNQNIFNQLYKQGKLSKDQFAKASRENSEFSQDIGAQAKNLADVTNPTTTIARGARTILDIGTLGKAPTILQSGVKNAAVVGAGIGAGYGVADPIAQGERGISNIAKNAAIGSVLGAGLGAGGEKLVSKLRIPQRVGEAVGKTGKKVSTEIKPFVSKEVVNKLAKETNPALVEAEVRRLIPEADDDIIAMVTRYVADQKTPGEVERVIRETAELITPNNPIKPPNPIDVKEIYPTRPKLADDLPQPKATVAEVPGSTSPKTTEAFVASIIPNATDADKKSVAQLLEQPDIKQQIDAVEEVKKVQKTAEDVTPQGEIATPQQQAAEVVQQTQGTDASVTGTAQSGNPNIAADLAQAAEASRARYEKPSVAQKAQEAWNPYVEGARIDAAAAKAQGVPHRDLPKSESVEATAEQARLSRQRSDEYLRNSPISEVIKKYQNKGEDSQNFNVYRLFMRDIEQRADGRPPILTDPNTGQIIPDEVIINFIKNYEARNPEARGDLLKLSSSIRDLQEMSLNGLDNGPGIISQADLAAARTKKDGTEFQFYTPIQRALPDEVERAQIGGSSVGSIGQQRVLQDFKGGKIPLDPTFDALTDYSDTVFRQLSQAKVADIFARRVEQGIVPGTRFTQTASNEGLRKDIQATLQDLRKDEGKLKVTKGRTATNLRIAGKDKKRAEDAAATRAKQLLKEAVDPDAAAAIDTLNRRELVDMFSSLIDNKATSVERVRKNLINKGGAYEKLAYNLEKQRNALNEIKDTKRGLRNEQISIAPDPTTGLQVISGIREGNKFRIEVQPEHARFLQGLDAPQLNGILKGFKAATEPIRTGLTGVLNPPFAIVNSVFNSIMSPILSPQGLKVFTPSAVKESLEGIFRNTDFQNALYSRGAQRFTGSLQTSARNSSADALAAERGALDKLKNYARNPVQLWRELDVIGARLDQSSRTGIAKAAYDARINKGGTAAQAMDDAVYAYNNVLPNFGRVSNVVRQADAVLMYGGASQAGTRALFTALKRDPVGVGGRLSLAASGLIAGTAYSLNSNEEFYKDMKESGRKYILDNNIIIALPGAHKNEKTGQWEGIVKIPIAPELRAMNHAIWSGMTEDNGVPIKDYALAMLDFTTGGARTLSNPLANVVYGAATGVDPRTGYQFRDPDNPDSENNAATKEYLLRSFGLPGKAIADGNPLGTVASDLKNRFVGAKGESAGGEFYRKLEDDVKDLGLSKNEKKTLYADVVVSRKNAQGETVTDKSYYDSAQKAIALLENPKLLEISKRMNARNLADGKPGDPFFDLDPQQQKIILNLQANYSPGNKEEKAIQRLNPWIKDFNEKRSAFYDQIKSTLSPEDQAKQGVDPKGLNIPKPTGQVEQKLAQLNALKDSKQRGEFIRSNQDVADFFQEQTDYQRAKRDFLGLPQFDEYPKAAPELQKLLDGYNSLPKGEGPPKRDGTPSSPTRSNWIKSHPNEWSQIGNYFDKVALWNAAEEGSLAVYEGIDFDQKTIDKIASNGNGGKGYNLKDPEGQRAYLAELLPALQARNIKQPEIDARPRNLKLKIAIPKRPSKTKRIQLKS